jgi:hypothetical protein
MYTSFAVAGLTNLAERHGYLLENASCLCWGSAFCIEGLLLLGHNSKTALEDRCHLFITITAFLSALGLWSILIPAVNRRAVYAAAFFITLHGIQWMLTALYLGFCFKKYLWKTPAGDGGSWIPQPGWVMSWTRSWGPYHNHTVLPYWTPDAVWKQDWTSPHDIMVLHSLVSFTVLLNSMAFVLHVYRPGAHDYHIAWSDERVEPDAVTFGNGKAQDDDML